MRPNLRPVEACLHTCQFDSKPGRFVHAALSTANSKHDSLLPTFSMFANETSVTRCSNEKVAQIFPRAAQIVAIVVFASNGCFSK